MISLLLYIFTEKKNSCFVGFKKVQSFIAVAASQVKGLRSTIVCLLPLPQHTSVVGSSSVGGQSPSKSG